MTRSLYLRVLLASFVVVALPRWLLRSQVPYNWDAANFTLAVGGIDLQQHRPHPPAAVGYVLAARPLQPLVAGDPHEALVLVNILLGVASCLLVFTLARAMSADRRDRRAWLAWVVFAASVQHAFNSCVAEVYMSELATTLLVAWLAWLGHRGSSRALVAMAAALAVAGAFRLTGMVFMLPLACYALIRGTSERKTKVLAVGVYLAVLSAWLLPLLWWAGASNYVNLLWRQLAESSHDTNLAAAHPLVQLNRNLRDVVYSLISGVGVFNLVVLPLAALVARPPLPSRRAVVFGACWFLPGALFFVGIHMGKMGYTLFLLPVGALTIAYFYSALDRTRSTLLLVCGQLSLGALHFTGGLPPEGEMIGEGLRYKHRTLVQKVLTETRALFSTTAPMLRRAERELALARRAVEGSCPTGNAAVLVAGDGEGLNWRRAMQAFPDHMALRVPDPASKVAFVGRAGDFEIVASEEVVFDACAAVWFLPEKHPLNARTSALAELPDWPVVTRGPLKLELVPGTTLILAGSRGDDGRLKRRNRPSGDQASGN